MQLKYIFHTAHNGDFILLGKYVNGISDSHGHAIHKNMKRRGASLLLSHMR